MRKSVMGFFDKKQIEDKPIDYHAGVVAVMLGGRISATQLPEDQQRFGSSIAGILNLYASTLGAPALLNMLAIGSGKEFAPRWDKENVRSVLATHGDSLSPLKDAFVAYSRDQITETDLINTIIRIMGHSPDANLPSAYDEGLLYTAHQILAELAEKVKSDTRNGLSGQIANDAYMQGVVASTFISLLIASETFLK